MKDKWSFSERVFFEFGAIFVSLLEIGFEDLLGGHRGFFDSRSTMVWEKSAGHLSVVRFRAWKKVGC